MLELIFTFLAASMWCFGFHAVILKVVYAEIVGVDVIDEWDRIPRFIKLIIKPLFACPYCMASVHGTIIYFIFVNQGIVYWPIFCICLCGFNYLLAQFINE